jgi:hypothetical protein
MSKENKRKINNKTKILILLQLKSTKEQEIYKTKTTMPLK